MSDSHREGLLQLKFHQLAGGHAHGLSALQAGSGGPDGRAFAGIQELKHLLLQDEAAIARNLARQLSIYATGAPVRYSDREAIETILQHTAAGHYGVRDLIEEIVQSDLFKNK